jgi:hypothetical protein
MRPAITFDNQISTGIQAFGHCGSPTCTMTSAFGANPDVELLGDGDMAALALGQNLPQEQYTAEQQDKRTNSLILGIVLFAVISSFVIAKKASDE